MKKICFLFCFILLASNLFLSNFVCESIYADTTYYARIVGENIPLYSSPTILENDSNIMFILPNTYFVEVLDEENDQFYKVQFQDLIGFVKDTDITFVKDKPNTMFQYRTFMVFSQIGLPIRDQANTITSKSLVTIPFLTGDIIYYGTKLGEESIVYCSNKWYYCKFTQQNVTYCGYVYAYYTDILTPEVQNNEIHQVIPAPDFSVQAVTQPVVDNISSLDKTQQIVIIAVACLPCFIIIWLLFKPTRIADERGTKHKRPKKKIKRLRKSDYFEFDDEYINS